MLHSPQAFKNAGDFASLQTLVSAAGGHMWTETNTAQNATRECRADIINVHVVFSD